MDGVRSGYRARKCNTTALVQPNPVCVCVCVHEMYSSPQDKILFHPSLPLWLILPAQCILLHHLALPPQCSYTGEERGREGGS